ncbi:hypothetical protein GCM10022219_09550 [Microbacterium oryzae]|uniref:Phage tail protein n=1 Tax=Microbacterium oryzae TaxID=743009 RepID=A0A6I6E2P2_9MICO|nr:hypothetical protein [Microbacterium oryzae]QGU27017.1 hypothetical protein D7D94_04565 [Microbacterium oryzae]
MTTISRDHLLDLLPAHYRDRDGDPGRKPDESGALGQYLQVLADELAAVADGIDQLYDDLFVETAAPWVLPYLAELIGLRGLPGSSVAGLTSRAEVANTIGYRRRKGTAAVLEQVAPDVTGWPAKAVEYFELLAALQHMNHIRPQAQVTASIRNASRVQFAGGPFERGVEGAADAAFSHLPEVRRIRTRRGRYNIPNVGVHLWRLQAQQVSDSPAVRWEPGDQRRFLFDPLGGPVQLFTQPVTETDITQATQPINVPMPIGRLMLNDWRDAYYGSGLSVSVEGIVPTGPSEKPPRVIVESANLSDAPSGEWGNMPTADPEDLVVRIDPVLGRLAFSDDRTTPPLVTFRRGFSAHLGGGEYDRVDSFASPGSAVQLVADGGRLGGTAVHSKIADALTALPGSGVVEVVDSHSHDAPSRIIAHGISVEIRGQDQRRPIVRGSSEIEIDLDDIAGAEGSVILNGLVVVGAALRVTGRGVLTLRHCTLVPGRDLLRNGGPLEAGAVSVYVDDPGVSLVIERSIVGGIRAHVDADVSCRDSVIDAGEEGIAFASADGPPAEGGTLTLDECTVLGRIRARVLERVSNTIVLAGVPSTDAKDWPAPVIADRRQQGCVRFSYLPPGSRTPRRYRGVSDADAAAFRPVFTSERYGAPGYIQLDRRTVDAVWRGADDESEMGALHHLNQPLREAYLERRLGDYTRFGLEIGLFFQT